MTTLTDIANRALQAIGTRSDVTDAELTNETSNEAKQFNLIATKVRDQLLRLAPWDCAFNYQNLTYITSVPGTPENSSSVTQLWEKGQPPPPWSYEYQYPVNCLRACWIVPQFQAGFSGGVPITTAVTGGAPAYWQGPPVMFKVVIDQFYPVTAAAIVAGGTGYAVGDIITLPGIVQGDAPIGAPVQLRVATLGVGSAIATVTVVNQIAGEASPQGGSYFERQTGTIAQSSTTGSGTGATFTLTFGAQGDQRVIVTNQEYATLAHVKQVTNPNVMDEMFIEAWASGCAAIMSGPLTGDKDLKKLLIAITNDKITEARKADGNEGLTVNNVLPDWLRERGINTPELMGGGFYSSFDWGGLWSGW